MSCRILFLAIILAPLVACSSMNRARLDESEVASRLGVEKVAVARDVRFTNLCTRKECEGMHLLYTRTFRRAALLTRTVEEIDYIALQAAVDGGEPGYEIVLAREEVPILRAEIEDAWRDLNRLSPTTDLEDPDLVKKVTSALSGARFELRAAGDRLTRVERNLNLLLPRNDETLNAEDVPSIDWHSDDTEVRIGQARVELSRAIAFATGSTQCTRLADAGK